MPLESLIKKEIIFHGGQIERATEKKIKVIDLTIF